MLLSVISTELDPNESLLLSTGVTITELAPSTYGMILSISYPKYILPLLPLTITKTFQSAYSSK